MSADKRVLSVRIPAGDPLLLVLTALERNGPLSSASIRRLVLMGWLADQAGLGLGFPGGVPQLVGLGSAPSAPKATIAMAEAAIPTPQERATAPWGREARIGAPVKPEVLSVDEQSAIDSLKDLNF